MSKAGEDTMCELDNILNASETYADRLAAFLQLKTAPKPKQSNTPFVLGGLDISFDFDVDLVKLPPKAQPPAAKDAEPKAEEQPLRQITNEFPNSAEPAQTEAAVALLPAKENVNTSQVRDISSPRRSIRRSIPGSDRLRRVAIQRRSRSCGRRELLKEFNNACANNSSFLPTQSNTPLTENEPAAEPENQTNLSEAKPPERPAPVDVRPKQQDDALSNITQSNSSISQHSMQRQTMSDSDIKRRTYTIEVGPKPGQLLLSPSGKTQLSPSNSNCNVFLRQSHMYPRSSAEQSKLSAAPARRMLSAPSSEPDYIVPESPQLDLQQVVQNLTRNSSLATTPFMVVPMACLNAKPANEKAKAAPSTVTPTTRVTNRSIQTSSSPRAIREIHLNDILTEDESAEEQQIASAGGSSIQVLDLHYSCPKNSRRRSNRRTRQTVLNKPLQRAINGEQFAQELAGMSNYEVLDLRKRQYRSKLHPLNGHRERSIEQLPLEHQHLDYNLPRRNLDQSCVKQNPITSSSPHKISAAATKSGSDSDFWSNTTSMQSPAAPPLGFRDRSLHQRRSRLSRHETFMLESIPTARTALPPIDFRDNSIQSQPRKKKTKQRRTRFRHREPPVTSDEDQLLEVCTPPAQFRWSKSRRQSELMETPETSLAAPPSQFIDVPETDAEEELRQQSIQSSYMEDLRMETPTPPPEQSLIEDQLSTSADSQMSMRLRSSRRQSKNKKQLRKSEQQEQEKQQQEMLKKVNRLQKEQHQKEQQKKQKQLRQEQQQKEQQEKVQKQKEQQQKEQQEKEQQQKKQQQNEQQQKKQQQKEQQQWEQQQLEQQEKEQRQKEHQEKEQLEKELRQKEQQERQEQLRQQQQQKRLEEEHEEMLQKEQQKKENQLQMEQRQKNQEQQEEEQQQQVEQQLMEEPNQEQVLELELEQLPPPEVVFKKPIAPAPRSKRYKKSKVEAELGRLTINLRNETLPPDEQEASTEMAGVRRSRRGHVPLCNTWSHTLSDPFHFMYKNLAYFEMPVGYKSRPQQRPTAANSISFKNRPPMASSTPCHPTAPISENRVQASAAPPAEPKRRGRKKKTPPGETAAQPAETHVNLKKGDKKKK